MRCMELWETLTAFAMALPGQWVIASGGSVQVKATIRATMAVATGGVPSLRVLARSRPSTPSLAN